MNNSLQEAHAVKIDAMMVTPLQGFDSDDGDEADTVAPLAGHAHPEVMANAEDKEATGAFFLSQSGAFKVADFHIRPEGGLTATSEARTPSPARPSELELAVAAPSLEVSSISDLEMLDKLGSGTHCSA